MVERRGLLDTGKDIASSAAGTFKSAAGTVAEKGKEAGTQARSVAGTFARKGGGKVKEQFNELTDDTVTDQEKARLERAREEALEEARKEARQEFQEEYRENLVDEAFDKELNRLRQRNPQQANVIDREPQEQTTQDTQAQNQEPAPQPAPMNMGLFGVPQQPRQPAEQTRPEPEPEPQPVQARMGLFGVPQQQPKQQRDQSEQRVQRDPLFGLRL